MDDKPLTLASSDFALFAVPERFEQDAAWQAQALKGIAEPQTGVGFLKDQGVWYTPFNRPNMPGRYDIRHLHDQNKAKD